MTSDVPGNWQGRLDRADLHESNMPREPLTLFDSWFETARGADIIEPAAMTLATIDADGTPSARIVLLKGHGTDGFRFYTNYDSRKGQALTAHPQAALVFWWEALERQIRITGSVAKLAPQLSDAYYNRRSRGSRLGAHASPQSQVIGNREQLDARLQATAARFPGDVIPRPDNWGGYMLTPNTIEFWQARHSRLHDRLRYQRDGDAWLLQRLAP